MIEKVTTKVVENGLCIGCGICVALCPENALTLKFNSKGEYNAVEITSCTSNCGICIKTCPFGDNSNEDAIGLKLFSSIPEIKHTSETGYFLKSYVGFAEEKYRNLGASGGIASWILETLLVNGYVDKIICVAPNNNFDKLFHFTIISDPGSISKCSGSVYYPVEMSDAIKYVLNTPGKFAITGLPCFIKAIRLAQELNVMLKEKIVFTLGLTCGQMKTKYFTEYVASLAGLKDQLKAVSYRVKDTKLSSNNFKFSFIDIKEDKKTINFLNGPYDAWVNGWFTIGACDYCDDVFAECADISLMDAWLPQFIKDHKGTNLIIVRSILAYNILLSGSKNKKIFINPINIKEVIKSQDGVIEKKRLHLAHILYENIKNHKYTPNKRVYPRLGGRILKERVKLRKEMKKKSVELWLNLKPNAKKVRYKMAWILIKAKFIEYLYFLIKYTKIVFKYIFNCLTSF